MSSSGKFADGAVQLCGQAAVLLGWRPDDFWSATPAELGSILTAMTPEQTEPLDGAAITILKEQFPDG